MLEELDLPLEIVCEATNGEELAFEVSQHFPDVAFVDIRMPKLSGLKAIRAARSASPQTKWFILTGFPEFDYAQEAIRLGVSGYLLKPVNPDELRKVLSDLIAANRKQITAQNIQYERELIALDYGLTTLELDEQDSFLRRSTICAAIIYLDSHLAESTKAERQLKFCRAIRRRIDQSLDNHNRIALYVLPGGELTTVGAWATIPGGQAESRVREFFRALEHEAGASSDGDLAITVLLTDDCSTYGALQEQINGLLNLAPLRATCGIGERASLAALKQQAATPGRLELSNLILNLCRCYQERSYLHYMKAVQQLEKFLLRTNCDDAAVLSKPLVDFLRRSLDCHLSGPLNPRDWSTRLQQHGERILHEPVKDEVQSMDLIDQVIAYIDQNYMLDVGLGQLAERFYITPNYLSTLFHKKTGVNFMSYLKEIRMLRAKELLADTNIQIQQVAEQVGYFSARHFARLFAEHYGCLPSEYRDQAKKR
jgi:two-component system response regulator YesN